VPVKPKINTNTDHSLKRSRCEIEANAHLSREDFLREQKLFHLGLKKRNLSDAPGR